MVPCTSFFVSVLASGAMKNVKVCDSPARDGVVA